jgi:hypothetical protein
MHPSEPSAGGSPTSAVPGRPGRRRVPAPGTDGRALRQRPRAAASTPAPDELAPRRFLDHTGHPSWLQQGWAAVHLCWPAALAGQSALRVVEGPGSRRPASPIEVAVNRNRSLTVPVGIRCSSTGTSPRSSERMDSVRPAGRCGTGSVRVPSTRTRCGCRTARCSSAVAGPPVGSACCSTPGGGAGQHVDVVRRAGCRGCAWDHTHPVHAIPRVRRMVSGRQLGLGAPGRA